MRGFLLVKDKGKRQYDSYSSLIQVLDGTIAYLKDEVREEKPGQPGNDTRGMTVGECGNLMAHEGCGDC